MSQFGRYAEYYDVIYQDKDYESESEYFLNFVFGLGRADPVSILEYGAGTGRHQEFFKRAGLQTVGVEISSSMCEVGAARGANIVNGDIRTYRHEHKVDALIGLFHVVSYVTDEQDLHRMFSRARENLLPSGVFVFDVWFEPGVIATPPQVRVKRCRSDQVEVVRVAEPHLIENEKIVVVDYQVFVRNHPEATWTSFSESHRLRYFSISDLKKFAVQAGFRLSHWEETFTGLSPSSATWGLTAVFETC